MFTVSVQNSSYPLLLLELLGFDLGHGYPWMLRCCAAGRADGLQTSEHLWFPAAERSLCRAGHCVDACT